jgi:fimbrial chaperone protein
MQAARWICGALLSLAAASAAAGSFSVAPTRIEFDAGRRTAVISLRNVDASPLTVQATMVGWTQSGGQDVYAATRDLLATPPVFTIPPNGEQIVRVALRRAADGTLELPYRIFFQEVPQPGKAATNTLNIALRIGVPVFVAASDPVQAMALQWQVARTADGDFEVSASNAGRSHVQVTGFQLQAGTAAVGAPVSAIKYVLPGNRMSWKVALPEGTDLSQLRVSGNTDQGEFAAPAAFMPSP